MIFDLDGVLVTTDQYHYRAWKEIADEAGIAFDQETNNRLRGVSRAQSLEIILEKTGKVYLAKEKLSMAERKNEIYKRLIRSISRQDILPEAEETLVELRARGIRTALGSSSRNAVFILEQTGLSKYFDAVSDGNGLQKSKPDPEVFERAARLLGVTCTDCLVVEDAGAGIEAAKAAGMYAAGIGDAQKSGKCDFRIERLSEIPAIVRVGKFGNA